MSVIVTQDSSYLRCDRSGCPAESPRVCGENDGQADVRPKMQIRGWQCLSSNGKDFCPAHAFGKDPLNAHARGQIMKTNEIHDVEFPFDEIPDEEFRETVVRQSGIGEANDIREELAKRPPKGDGSRYSNLHPREGLTDPATLGMIVNTMGGGGNARQIYPASDAEDLGCGARFIPGEVTLVRRQGIKVDFVRDCQHRCCWHWLFPDGSRSYHYDPYDFEQIGSECGEIPRRGEHGGVKFDHEIKCPACGNIHVHGGFFLPEDLDKSCSTNRPKTSEIIARSHKNDTPTSGKGWFFQDGFCYVEDMIDD